MKFESSFRPKPKQELEKQLETVESDNDIKLTHESMEQEVGLLEVSELKEKYKVRYDAYLEMLRAERQEGQNEESDFFKAKVLINALNNLDDYIVAQERGEHRVLRGKQIPVFNEIRNALERGVRAGYIKLPTGVGKTVLFTQLIEAMNLKALIGVPKINLVKKTGKEIKKRTTKTYGEYTSKRKDTSKDITTITYPSLINAVRDEKIGKEEFPLIILDEAHKALGPETEKAINFLSGIKIGFTATPDYSSEHAVSKLLPEEVYTMTLREAIQEGLSCRTKTIHAYTEVDLSDVPVNRGKYDDEKLEKAVNVRGRNMAALELYEKKFNHLKSMVNCSGIEHSKEVARLFEEQGIKVAHIDGTMTEDEQNKIIEKFENGEIMVITNAKLLLEGFDEQSLAVALNLDPTLSLVNAEQRGGRPLRIQDGNPDKWAYVIDFIDKNSKKNQVLFSEILGGDKVLAEEEEENENGIKKESEKKELEKEPSINFDDLNIEGLRIVVNTKDILEVTKKYSESRQDKKEWDYEDLREDIISKGIRSSKQYSRQTKFNAWPSTDSLTSMPEFPKNPDGTNDWDTFFEREKFDFEKFRQKLIALGVKSSTDYTNRQKENKWPSTNWLNSRPEFPVTREGFKDWKTFLGIEKFNFQKFHQEILALGVKSSADYDNYQKEKRWPVQLTLTSMPEFPKNPDGTNDWDTFLNREKRKEWTYEELRQDILAKEIKSTVQYFDKRKDNQWPVASALFRFTEFPKKEDDSPDWDTFLNREKRKEWTYEELRREVIDGGVKSTMEYDRISSEKGWYALKFLKKMPEFPKNPDGTPDYDTFFGREKFDYEKFRQEVISAGVKSSTDYSRLIKEKKWPSWNRVVKLPEFPKNPDGTNDWEDFLGQEKFDLVKFRQEVLNKKVKSSTDYANRQKENKWPSPNRLVGMIGFPKNPDGTNDWKSFFDPNK